MVLVGQVSTGNHRGLCVPQSAIMPFHNVHLHFWLLATRHLQCFFNGTSPFDQLLSCQPGRWSIAGSSFWLHSFHAIERREYGHTLRVRRDFDLCEDAFPGTLQRKPGLSVLRCHLDHADIWTRILYLVWQ